MSSSYWLPKWMACIFVLIMAATILYVPCYADKQQIDLSEMALEDLMDIEVTSVSKKAEKLSDAAGAVYVVTGDEIRQSGARSIPDALRMVPGLHVASIDASTWAISSRGFNSQFSNKLLVLIDGRSVYNTLFSGVWWDVQDLALEDIDRIEVIRGPGATLWGANAVNGVINVITKESNETQGLLVSGAVGDYEKSSSVFRYGTSLGGSSYIRAYGKYFDKGNRIDSIGNETADGWSVSRGGFRFDSELSDNNSLTIQGHYYEGSAGETYTRAILTPPYLETNRGKADVSGGGILSRWTNSLSESSDLSVQVYFDHANRRDSLISADLQTIDLELQHSFMLNKSLDFVWGLGYRNTRDKIYNNFQIIIEPSNGVYNLLSGFVQGTYDLLQDRLKLTLGTKIEHNDYTDWEIQPNARLFWRFAEYHALWASVSRAVRTPSRGERDGSMTFAVLAPLSLSNPTSYPIRVVYSGRPGNGSEKVTAYELGYRTSLINNVSLDFAGFYNDYRNLINGEVGRPYMDENFPEYMVLPITINDTRKTHTYGLEAASDWFMRSWMHLRASYSYLWSENSTSSTVSEDHVDEFEVQAPKHRVGLSLFLNPENWLNCGFRYRYVDPVSTFNIGSYSSVDARVAFLLWNNLEIAVSGEDILNASHEEFKSEVFRINSQIERRFIVSAQWGF